MNDRVNTLLGGRRERMTRVLGRPLTTPEGDPEPASPEARRHLREEGEELYWNELEWENITAEEDVEGGRLVSLTFPGFMAFIRGLLLEETMPDALAPAEPRPEVVRDLIRFLAGRVVELEEELAGDDVQERPRLRAELAMTSHLVDHVLYLYHGVDAEEVEELERTLARS
jgi:hypothetical protein